MNTVAARLSTYSFLPREVRSSFPVTTAAKQGFFVSGDLRTLCCYRCGYGISLSGLENLPDSNAIITGHTVSQCVQILALGLDEDENSGKDGHGSVSEPTPLDAERAQETPGCDDTAITDEEDSVTNDDRVKCDSVLINHAISIGFDPDDIDIALDEAEPDAKFETITSLVAYLIEHELKRDRDALGYTNLELDENMSARAQGRKKRTLTAREKARRLRRMSVRGKVDKKRESDPVEILTPEIKALAEELEDAEDDDLCKICVCEPSTTVLIPCGHFMMCAVCAAQQYNCPVCRATILRTIAVNTE